MTVEAKPGVTNKDVGVILRNSGIDVISAFEGSPPVKDERGAIIAVRLPYIQFHGDESEGFKAVRILHERGIPVGELKREWHFCGWASGGSESGLYGAYVEPVNVCWTLIPAVRMQFLEKPDFPTLGADF